MQKCEHFQFQTLTEDQFKCLIFIVALHSPHDADVRTRLLCKLQQDKDVTGRTLTTECQRLMTLKRFTMMVQYQPSLSNSFTTSSVGVKENPPNASRKIPPTARLLYGEWHFTGFYPFKKPKRQICHKREHKEKFVTTRKPNLQINFKNSFGKYLRKNRTENV